MLFKNFKISKNALKVLSRHGHTLRGKPPGIARTLQQRLKEETALDFNVPSVNIGFPAPIITKSQHKKEELEYMNNIKNNSELQAKARNFSLQIDLDTVKKEHSVFKGPYHLEKIARHYGIYKDLFPNAHFLPRVHLNIQFQQSECDHIVFNGNVIKPTEASIQPNVSYDHKISLYNNENKEEKSLWTLVLTNPDNHIYTEGKECLHWFVSNIPNNEFKKGDIIVPYLQPFPPKGIGFQRFIFILYKQTKKLDFATYKIEDIHNLESRLFETSEFYRKYQDHLTPAGLAFFQTDWDRSVTNFYHKILATEEPIYEYDFPKPYIKDQKWFPLKEPFNSYMDKYRDPRDVLEKYLKEKLSKTHPFNGPEPPLRFPNAHSLKNMPSWMKTETRKKRYGWGRINDL